jgi:hypothetical protein
MSAIESNVSIVFLLFVFLACGQTKLAAEGDGERKIIIDQKAREEKHSLKGIREKEKKMEANGDNIGTNSIIQCKRNFNYIITRDLRSDIQKVNEIREAINWNKSKKTEILRLLVQNDLKIESGVNILSNNEKEEGIIRANILIGMEGGQIDERKRFILKDNEVNTKVYIHEKKNNITVRSWTAQNNLEKLNKNIGKYYLRRYVLTAWGIFRGREVLVFSIDSNIGGGLAYSNKTWHWLPWRMPADLPIYGIILWKEEDAWRTKIQSKSAAMINLDDICNMLKEDIR